MVQFLKPGYAMEKDYANETQTSFSSTADEWKSATMMGKADSKILQKPRIWQKMWNWRNVAFQICSPSLSFLAGFLVPSKELDSPESSVRGECSSWRVPPPKQQLLVVWTENAVVWKHTRTPAASPIMPPKGTGGAGVELRAATGTGSAQQCLALGSCWLVTGQGKDKSQSHFWYRAGLQSFVTAS